MKKRFIQIIAIILIISLLPVTALAAPKLKTGTISGFVSEKQLNRSLPLSEATVTLEGTDKTVKTNRLGRFTLTKVEAGEVSLVFSKDGYETIMKTVTVKANRLISVNVPMTKGTSATLVNISGKVKAEYEVVEVLATILRISPEFLPQILELIIPAETPFRSQIIEQISKLNVEDVINFLDNLGLLDIILENFNPQDIINLIPNIPPEIKDLLLKIVPSSISNQIPLPGTIITVRDDVGRVLIVRIADIKGSYKLNIPENYEVEYQLYGFETKKLKASEVKETTLLLPSPGIVKGRVTGENNEPLEGTLVTVTSAEGKPDTLTDAKGKYEIKGVKPLLPGFAGGIGGHTVLFDKDDYSPARTTALFVFGQAKADKKLELAPPFGNLEGLVDSSPLPGTWLLTGGITVNVYDSSDELVRTEKITAKIPDDINNLIKGKYSFIDLPVGVYKVEFSAKVSLFSSKITVQTVPDVVIKAGKTTTLDVIIKELANNAKLSSITPSSGELKPNFKANTKNYTVELAQDDVAIPTVGAVAQDSNATITITQPESVDGTATILVTAENGNATETYTVKFKKAAADEVIDISAIPGVTPPVTGATPVTTITETDQYTGIVAWLPAEDPFAVETVYTATITLTAKAGFTLTGVGEDFFKVAGATATNAADAGVVEAVFPETETAQILPAVIKGKVVSGLLKLGLGDVTVTVYEGTTVINSTTTETSGLDAGLYRMDVPVGADYTIKFEKAGYSTQDLDVGNLTAGDEKSIDITMISEMANINGLVTKGIFQPLSGVTIKVMDKEDNVLAQTTTSSLGAFSMDVSLVDSDKITFELSGYKTIEQVLTDLSATIPKYISVTLKK